MPGKILIKNKKFKKSLFESACNTVRQFANNFLLQRIHPPQLSRPDRYNITRLLFGVRPVVEWRSA